MPITCPQLMSLASCKALNGDKETVTFHMHVIRSNIRVWSCFVQVGAFSMHDSMILYGMFSMDLYLDTS